MDGQGQRWDAIVLGAGVSGLVAANLLQRQGLTRIAVVEEYAHIGGNHISRNIGPFTFDIGTLIFYDNSPFFGHFPNSLPAYHQVTAKLGRVIPSGEVLPYPISIAQEVLGRSPPEIARLVCSLAIARLFLNKPANAEDFVRFWIGRRLMMKSGLGSYMERFYGVRPSDIELDFATKRMNWISDAASLRNRIKGMLRSKSNQERPRQFVRARAGFPASYDPARRSLEQLGVAFFLGAKLSRIEKQERCFRIASESSQWQTDRLVSTIPLQRLSSLCGMGAEPHLRSVTLASLFFSFAGERGFTYSVLHNFSSSGRWKRLTMFSDFYGTASGREYFGVEVNLPEAGAGIDELAADFLTTMRERKLLQGDCRLEGHALTENAYPVYTGGASEAAARILALVRDFGIESLGRQGRFDYLPSAALTTATVESGLATALVEGET